MKKYKFILLWKIFSIFKNFEKTTKFFLLSFVRNFVNFNDQEMSN